jgi:hypothetical protein
MPKPKFPLADGTVGNKNGYPVLMTAMVLKEIKCFIKTTLGRARKRQFHGYTV